MRLGEENKLVLSVLRKNRGLSYSEISKLTGLSYGRVRTIVKWLKRFGLVEVYRIGRSCSVVLK